MNMYRLCSLNVLLAIVLFTGAVKPISTELVMIGGSAVIGAAESACDVYAPQDGSVVRQQGQYVAFASAKAALLAIDKRTRKEKGSNFSAADVMQPVAVGFVDYTLNNVINLVDYQLGVSKKVASCYDSLKDGKVKTGLYYLSYAAPAVKEMLLTAVDLQVSSAVLKHISSSSRRK